MDPNSPKWLSPAYLAMQPGWTRCRDVRAGTDRLRDKKSTYLPRFTAEDPLDWNVRIQNTTVVDFVEQAIGAYTGLALKTDPELGEDVPEELVEDWENLDGEGNHGAVVAASALGAMLCDGHIAFLTEHPPTAAGMTLAQQNALGVRPYVVLIKVDQILSWRTEVIGGHRWLMQLVIQETVERADGAFGTTCVTRYRVYRQRFELTDPTPAPSGAVAAPVEDLTKPFVAWEVWEDVKDAGAESTIIVGSGMLAGPQRIPLRVAYGGTSEAFLTSTPPLEGLALTNIRWAQVASERANTLQKCGFPIPVIVGELTGQTPAKPGADQVISPGKAMQVKAGGDFKIVAAPGDALEQQRLELEDWEKRAGSQSLAMLQRDISPETATASRMKNAKEQSKLMRAIRSLEDALEGVLMDMAAYRGLDPTGVSVTIRRDVGDVVDAATLQLLSQLEERGQLTQLRLLQELKRAGVMGNDFEPTAEVEALANDQGDTPPPRPDPATMSDDELAAEMAQLAAVAKTRPALKVA